MLEILAVQVGVESGQIYVQRAVGVAFLKSARPDGEFPVAGRLIRIAVILADRALFRPNGHAAISLICRIAELPVPVAQTVVCHINPARKRASKYWLPIASAN
jgi:hypothetical protein